jgi:hypothetical protein
MPRTRKKRTDAPMFDATVLRHNLREYGWRKQEADWVHEKSILVNNRQPSRIIEWYNKGEQFLLLAIHDNDTDKPVAVVLRNAGYGRAIYRLITGK